MITLTNNWYDQQSNQPYSRYSRISIEDAMDIAREQVPGEIVKVELEESRGILIYEVDIINAQGIQYEIDIDARTGRILNMKVD